MSYSIDDKNLNNKYSQKLLDSAKKFMRDAKATSKRTIQKATEATCNLTGDLIFSAFFCTNQPVID